MRRDRLFLVLLFTIASIAWCSLAWAYALTAEARTLAEADLEYERRQTAAMCEILCPETYGGFCYGKK